MLKSKFSGLQRCRWKYGSILIRLAVVASQICEIPRNPPKIQSYRSSNSSKVIDLDANRKRICNFLLVINSNYGRISYRFRDIDAFTSKTACFPTPPLFDAPKRRNALRHQRSLYMAQKLIGYNSVANKSGLYLFSRCWLRTDRRAIANSALGIYAICCRALKTIGVIMFTCHPVTLFASSELQNFGCCLELASYSVVERLFPISVSYACLSCTFFFQEYKIDKVQDKKLVWCLYSSDFTLILWCSELRGISRLG